MSKEKHLCITCLYNGKCETQKRIKDIKTMIACAEYKQKDNNCNMIEKTKNEILNAVTTFKVKVEIRLDKGQDPQEALDEEHSAFIKYFIKKYKK